VNDILVSTEAQEDAPLTGKAVEQEAHPRLPQYTMDEVQRGVEVIQLLIKVRDRCREQGLIEW